MIQVIRVILADNHPLLRIGLRTVLAAEQDFALVGEAIDCAEALRLSQQLHPTVLILSVTMSGATQLDLLTALRHLTPTVHVVILGGQEHLSALPGLIVAGISGFLVTEETPDTVVRALRTVAHGDTWFSQSVLAQICHSGAPLPASTHVELRILTPREIEVVQFLGAGYSNHRIAGALAISERTVRFHLRNVCDKLGVQSRGELLAWAIRQEIGQSSMPAAGQVRTLVTHQQFKVEAARDHLDIHIGQDAARPEAYGALKSSNTSHG